MKYKIWIIGGMISMFLCLSCSDWLNVKPLADKDKDEALSNQNGFRNALVGAYIRMKSGGLYGREMTWGIVENLAQHWEYENNSVGAYLNTYNYKALTVENAMGKLYNNLYKVVADVNSILEVLDAKQNLFSKGEYELIKGEATAIRAYCHFDILRLFGPVPTALPAGKVLPYVTTVSVTPNQHKTYEEFTNLLLADLDTAEKNLGEVDPVRTYSIKDLNKQDPYGYGADDTFWGYRQMRMNYYAVLAEKARVYLWLQNKTKALEYATEVVRAKDKDGMDRYTLGTKKDIASYDYTFSSEHILSLNIYNMSTAVNTETTYHKAKADLLSDLFINTSTDVRFEKWWEEVTNLSITKNQLKKYTQNENMPDLAKNALPLIRLYEMYLIMMECLPLEEAVELYQKMAVARDFEIVDEIRSTDDLENVLIREYNREFYGEGQAFYAYKRLNWKTIFWTSVEGGIDTYVIPLPRQELSYNK